jgi:hypothetical protein
MKRLIEKSGPVPDDILVPRIPDSTEIDWRERLNRFYRENIMGFRITYASARNKACFANQRVILGAVEMYNIDNPGSPIESIVDADVSFRSAPLVSGGYLKDAVPKADLGCEYCSYGNLNQGGITFCRAHGTIPDYRRALAVASGFDSASRSSDYFLLLALAIIFMFCGISLFIVYRFASRKRIKQSD